MKTLICILLLFSCCGCNPLGDDPVYTYTYQVGVRTDLTPPQQPISYLIEITGSRTITFENDSTFSQSYLIPLTPPFEVFITNTPNKNTVLFYDFRTFSHTLFGGEAIPKTQGSLRPSEHVSFDVVDEFGNVNNIQREP